MPVSSIYCSRCLVETSLFPDCYYSPCYHAVIIHTHSTQPYWMSSVSKFTILGMNCSFTMTVRMAFQSGAFSPNRKQMDSSAILTAGGGLPIERTSTKCCFLMAFTAAIHIHTWHTGPQSNNLSLRPKWELSRGLDPLLKPAVEDHRPLTYTNISREELCHR